ncbi:MAG TPA: NADPH:quinone oxidoreductase family protein [Casimicrobiaceae bacterium]|nr:NADPH:quinone oxidoreductase family protein [Casimicrobiaceae bacterium]
MRALRCHAFGPVGHLALEEIASPTPGPHQAVVSVKAAAVNFPDTLIVQGKYQIKPELPFTPGGEYAGVVKDVGEMVTHVKPGDAVFGVGVTGGFAEEALIDAANLHPLPAGADFAVAAALTMAYGTTIHALKDRGKLVAGETLLVLGAGGGVGLAALEIGKLMGATVIAAASTDAKLDICHDRGADDVINYDREDLKERVRVLTDGRGADVIYDPVGGGYTAAASRSVAWNGRYLVIGFAAGEIPQIPLNLPLLKGYSIVGVYWGAFAQREPAANAANMKQLTDWIAAGKLAPLVSARYPLEQAVDALFAMMRREVAGKVVIVP